MNARVLPFDESRRDAVAGEPAQREQHHGPQQDPPVFDERRFRHALGRFATGVVVISSGTGEQLHAMTANAFMSGSLKPPLIVVSVAHRARMHQRLMDGDAFGVSVLSHEQESHSRHFAGDLQAHLSGSGAPTFAAVEGMPGVALLERAVARFAARIVDRHPCGDHTLFIGEVRLFALDEHAPLVFFGGQYASVGAAPAVATAAG